MVILNVEIEHVAFAEGKREPPVAAGACGRGLAECQPCCPFRRTAAGPWGGSHQSPSRSAANTPERDAQRATLQPGLILARQFTPAPPWPSPPQPATLRRRPSRPEAATGRRHTCQEADFRHYPSWAVPCHCPSPRCSGCLFPPKNLPITDGQAWCVIVDQPRLAVWRVSTRSLRLARKAAATPSSGRGPGTGAVKRLMVVVEGPNWPLNEDA